MATIGNSGSPPVNESERRAVEYLVKELPDTFEIFPNLTIETKPHQRPDEFDMVIVGPLAVYAVEVKGWGGRIRGNAYEWQLESGDFYRNPLRRNDQKAKGLSSMQIGRAHV